MTASARTRHHLHQADRRPQETVQASGSRLHVHACPQVLLLGGDARRAQVGVAHPGADAADGLHGEPGLFLAAQLGRALLQQRCQVLQRAAVAAEQAAAELMVYAFELAQSREARHLTSATKSNGIVHSMPYWDARVAEMAASYPEVVTDQYHIDILTANFVRMPEHFDVVVGSNLFGDILSDLGPAIAGSIGIAASANLNPSKELPSMFEPVHGSAPDIAGQGIANPIGTLWSAQMMLEFLGEEKAARSLMTAVESVTAMNCLTADLGGDANTRQFTDTVIENLS